MADPPRPDTGSGLGPILATIAGIALYSAMDAAMKGAALAIGAYSAYFLRCLIGVGLTGPIWWFRTRRFPRGRVLRIHLVRGVVGAFMGWSFFAAITRLPLAEAIAISFIAPLIALYLAAAVLKETIRPRAILGAILGFAGVMVIVGGRLGKGALDTESFVGIALILGSAVLFAVNLILQRQQALVASPLEASAFGNGTVALILFAGAPFLLDIPTGEPIWATLVVAAALAIGAAMLLTWAYARSETQRLVPIEYTGFLWASILGWWLFEEPVGPATLLGTILIVVGCLIATRRQRTEQTAI
ncbi:DMT family transporter [Erythrobacter litoralis]|uniref:DMT family transporter n=1 Tax=Erythrobacter litoralis TaxID=39960 RepID=UPI00243514D4|nr:DMT family transporter [Erythrobacter litoralis]MDG6080197.1 DMT family transporter [Erythrobacter litoralis]